MVTLKLSLKLMVVGSHVHGLHLKFVLHILHACKRSEKRAAPFAGATVINIGPEIEVNVSWTILYYVLILVSFIRIILI